MTPSELPLTVSVAQAAKLLGVSSTLCYEAVARGEIVSLRVGRRIVVPTWQFAALAPPTETE